MGWLDWLFLAVVLLLGGLACWFVARLKKNGEPVAGRMCAGCNDLKSLGLRFPEEDTQDKSES